jgi:hypothetical protein
VEQELLQLRQVKPDKYFPAAQLMQLVAKFLQVEQLESQAKQVLIPPTRLA